MQPTASVTLLELTEHLRQVVALNYREPLWIMAEVAQANASRGHLYLDLIEKNADSEEGIVAQVPAIVWARDWQQMRRQHGATLDEALREGRSIRCRVRVDFHERYGLKLHVVEVDTAYALGVLALERQQHLATLRGMDLLERQRTLALPWVCQRVAVVTSQEAAGWHDFRDQLERNTWGYGFRCTAFFAAVQGKNAPTELAAALAAISGRADDFDCVVLVRGGGAKLDLAAFDHLDVAVAVARCPLPVLAGVGHQTDETLLDLVAHTSLKTPTAVADFLVQRSVDFEQKMLLAHEQVRQVGLFWLKITRSELDRSAEAVQQAAHWQLRHTEQRLDRMAAELPRLARAQVAAAAARLDQAEAICAALHPDAVLRRGYSLTFFQKKILRSASDVTTGDLLETRTAHGTFRSRVED
jgi:exodeoxyribonuclease VII large subunit